MKGKCSAANGVRFFADFLVTKHGLAAAMQADNGSFETLHAYFLDRLLPARTQLLDRAADSGEIRADITAYALMRAIGNLCIGAEADPRYDARRMVALLVAGLQRSTAGAQTGSEATGSTGRP